MERFLNALVVAGGKDGGMAAMTRAAMLVRANGANLTVVDVVDPIPPLLEIPGIEEEELHEKMVARKRGELDLLAEPLKEIGVDVNCEVLQVRLKRSLSE
jgi:nucleotide-binding universal stress UspA family protein